MSVVANNILAGASGQGGGGYKIERSIRFNVADTPDLVRTPSSAGNTSKYTISFWVKRSKISATQMLIQTDITYSNLFRLYFDGNDNFRVHQYNGTYVWDQTSVRRFRDPSAWYHFVLALDTTQAVLSNRVKVYVNGEEITEWQLVVNPAQNLATGWNAAIPQRIGREFTSTYGSYYSFGGYLANFHNIDGQQLTPTDFGEFDDNNLWQPKDFAGSYGTNGFHLDFADNSSNAALGTDTSGNSNTWTVNNLSAISSPIYSNGWDTTNLNTSYGAANSFDGNTGTQTLPNNGTTATWTAPGGGILVNSSLRIYGRLESSGGTLNFNFSDSTTLTIAVNTSIQWYSVSGAAGKTLTSIVIGKDASGYEGMFRALEIDSVVLVDGTPSNTDSLVDTPTNGATASDTGAGGEITGCYATWNPLDKHSAVTLANGNLDISQSSSGFGKANIHVSSGKWYWEQTRTDTVASVAGIALSSVAPSATYLGGVSGTAGFNFLSGAVYSSSPITKVNSSNVGAQANGSVAGFALDCDNGTLKLYINGVLQTANHITFTPGTLVTPAFGTNGTAVAAYPTNFGQRAFAYAAPSGYKSLNTANLSSTIADGSKYFDTKLYTSNSSSLSVAGYEFSPSFVWIKNRASAQMHGLFDVVRGANQFLSSNRTNAEHTTSGSGFGTGTFNSFDSNGFTLGDDIGQNSTNYPSGEAHVAWAWDAGSSNTTIAVGGENSSVYDQSQTWSNGKDGDRSDYPVTNVFDASLTTVGYGSVNQTITVTLPGGSIALTSLRVRADRSGTATGKFYVNGNDYTSQISSGTNWNTITGETSITSIGYASDTGSNFVGLYAVEVNGKQLVDSGVTVANVPTIASTVRAQPSAGFSVVSYTGTSSDASVAHGLNAEPGFIIIKNRTTSGYWVAGHTSIGWDKGLYLNRSDAQVTAAYFGSSPSITTNTFSIGTASGLANANGDNFIAYCFAPVEGYSAMGSYQGNGNASGPFIYTGFKIRWLMVKSSSNSGEHWLILDTARDSYNVADATIYANLNNAEAEASALGIDLLSNGFKPRGTNAGTNASGYTYVYLAFASNPFASNGGLAR